MDRSTVSRTIYMHQRFEDPAAEDGEARIQWRPVGKAVKVGGWVGIGGLGVWVFWGLVGGMDAMYT